MLGGGKPKGISLHVGLNRVDPVHYLGWKGELVACENDARDKEDAEKVKEALSKRFGKFGLALHPEKTRLVEFGRNAERNAKGRGKKPATVDFLGFTHICARSRKGKFTVHVKTIGKRLRRGLKAVAEWCQKHRHEPVAEQQKILNAKLRGHYQYYGRPTNYQSLRQFYRRVRRIWREWLSRRTRGRWLTWERYAKILRQHPLLLPRIMHPWKGGGEYRLRNPLR